MWLSSGEDGNEGAWAYLNALILHDATAYTHWKQRFF